ncbi:uncharacterized protein LOC115061077 isoform X2 [Echeneis naucrates]|uniref:uncharacterized protein LOC115061077 isoform X2 n=1 Tax=Echeneis naucrates TaxID=173247 RepID=UPI00111375E3|nr:uncharacterized protein LOC115061077 isoform X2 [Echeneis naucrates]
MENTPLLRRPKRKLCYFTNKDSLPKQWSEPLTLEDVDKMFDDLDSPTQDYLCPPALLLNNSDNETKQSERDLSPVPQMENPNKTLLTCQMGPEGDALHHPTTQSPFPNTDIDVGIFNVHGPIKTSSPIDHEVVIEDIEQEDNEKKQVEPPVLFDCEDAIKEDTKIQSPANEKLNGHAPKMILDFESESPPREVNCSKVMVSPHKNKMEKSWQERLEISNSEEEQVTPERHSTSVLSQPPAETSTHVGKDMTAFLQRLRDAGHPKPARTLTSASPVKVPTPLPEPEDDFLILEDDTPLWFSIPSKIPTSKRQWQNKTSSTDKDSSTEKGKKGSLTVTAQKEAEPEGANAKLDTVVEKMKTKKGKEKNQMSGPANDTNESSSPQHQQSPVDNLVEQEESNEKTQLKKIPSKDKKNEEPTATASRKLSQKAQKASEMKSSNSSKDEKENMKTSRAKSLRRTKKEMQESESIEDKVDDEAENEQSLKRKKKNHADAGHTDKKAKQHPLLDDGSSSKESEITLKRKRKTGKWRLNCPQSTEMTEVMDTQPTVKMSKQQNKVTSGAKTSPMKSKKDRVVKKRNQKQPEIFSHQNTTKGKRDKNKLARGVTQDDMKATDELFRTTESGQDEEQQQQEVQEQDQDLDHVQSSSLALSHRDLSLNSEEQVFQRVYHPVSNRKNSVTSVPVSPRGPLMHLRVAEPEKRRRKPPGEWWTVDDKPKDTESISAQSQQLNPKVTKSGKERKKQAKQSRCAGLGTPKNGNMAVSSKPPGGAHVTRLKLKPKSTPKTLKHTLAIFKEITTSAAETPMAARSKDRNDNDGHNMHPGEDAAKDIGSMDANELRNTQNISIAQDSQQDNSCQHGNTLKDLRSGPSSMIALSPYAENDTISVPPLPRVPAALSVSDLCAPPLRPLILQPKDKANLTEWFKSLWSTTVNNGAEVSPDQFDWYFYQGRAIGVLADLNCDSICNGKMLLGSYMKKPLWVDHSATTVFNLLTSSVNVTIDGSQSNFHPGQSFMVQCGHAYSIQNITAQPAVLYFTRISAESPD